MNDVDFPGTPEFKKELLNHQKTLIEIFQNAKQFFDSHGYTYFIDAGTLLGAVRHGGFIPWDDDIDILMMKEHFDKLSQAIKKDTSLGKNFGLNIKVDSKIKLLIRIYLHGTDKEKTKKKAPTIDVFCYERYRFSQVSLLKTMYVNTIRFSFSLGSTGYFPKFFRGDDTSIYLTKNKFHKIRQLIKTRTKLKFLHKNFYPLFFMASIFYNFFTIILAYFLFGLLKIFVSHSGKYVHSANGSPIFAGFQRGILKYEDIFPLVELKFEGAYYKAPNNYKKLLTLHFKNYKKLPPYEKRKPNHIF